MKKISRMAMGKHEEEDSKDSSCTSIFNEVSEGVSDKNLPQPSPHRRGFSESSGHMFYSEENSRNVNLQSQMMDHSEHLKALSNNPFYRKPQILRNNTSFEMKKIQDKLLEKNKLEYDQLLNKRNNGKEVNKVFHKPKKSLQMRTCQTRNTEFSNNTSSMHSGRRVSVSGTNVIHNHRCKRVQQLHNSPYFPNQAYKTNGFLALQNP